jgi:hypothetical protein
MAIGRITGQMLSSTLSRATTDLTIATTGDSNLFHLDATNDRIGIGLNNPTVQLQTTGSALIGTDLTVTGNLTVNGSTTTVNSTTLTVDDKNIELSHSLSGASPTDAVADGGGIILKGDTDHTILWSNANDSWDFSEHVNLATGNAFKINNATVLDNNNLNLESIQINGNVISTSSNADLSLVPSGTGVLKLNGISIDGDVITSDDSTAVQFGEGVNINGNLDVGGGFTLSNGTSVTAILDEDGLGSNSATALATQQSIKAYVDSVAGGSLSIGDSASNTGSLDINAGDNLEFRSGDSITATVSGNGVTFDLNETISVDTITAGDSTAITVGSPTIFASSFKFNGDAQAITTVLDEDNLASDSATALATQQSIKAYVDSQVSASNTLTLGDDTSTEISLDLDNTLNVKGGNSITSSVAGDSLTFALNDDITVNQIGAKDSSAINITSPVYVNGALNTDTSLTIAGSTVVDGILDEDNLASNSATKLATQQSIKAYVDSVAGGTITLGDSSSNSGSVDINANQDLEFRSGNSITMTVSGNGVTSALNDDITVNQIGAKDSSAVSLTSPTQLTSTLQVAGASTLVGNTTIADDITIASGSITSGSGSISFGNENLTTTGNITGANITATGNVQVNGDLTVSGSTTSVNSTNITVSDPMLILSETNSGGADVDSGIMVERGSAGNNAAFYWNEGDDKFKAVLTTSDGTAITVTDSSVATIVADIESTGTSSFADVTLNQITANDSSAVSIKSPLQADSTLSVQGAATISGAATLGTSLTLASGSTVTAILDEDAFGSDSDTALATQQSIKAYVDSVAGGTLSIGDSASNTGSLDINAGDNLEFRSGDSITATVAGNGVTFDLNETISVDTITAGDSTAITVGSPMIAASSFKFNGDAQAITTILDEDNLASDSNTALATQQSIKAYVDANAGGTLNLGDSSSNAGAVDLTSDIALEFRSGDSITATVAGNGVTFDLNETISVDTITAGDSSAITVGSAMKSTSTFGFDGSVQVSSILDEDDMTSNSDTALATQQSIKAYVDAQQVSSLNDVGDVDAQSGDKLDGDVLIVNDDSSNVFTLASQLNTGLRVPSGTTAERPTVYTGIIRFNTSTGAYEGSTDGSTFVSFAMAGTAEPLNKDVFTGDGSATYTFSNVTNPSNQTGSNGALGLIVYIDNVLQEPTQNYTINNTTITFDSVVHSGARIVVIQGFDGGAGGGTGTAWKNVENTDVDSAIENVDTFDKATYRAVKYIYRIDNSDKTEYQAGEILIVHDGTTAYLTEYAKITTGNNDLITFTTDISGNDVRLRGQANTPNSNIQLKKLEIEVA